MAADEKIKGNSQCIYDLHRKNQVIIKKLGQKRIKNHKIAQVSDS